jgi:hypothetical protein
VKVDDLSVTEPAATSESAIAVTQPSPASGDESTMAVTQPIPVVTSERCAQCAAPLAPDQRYCLHCGAPRAHVNGPISGGRLAGSSPQAVSSSQATTTSGVPQSPPPGTPGVPSGMPPGFSAASSANRNNTLALLAGVGVLLLAMGVGVLIGRASAGTAKVPPAQVISVGGVTAGSSTPATTPTTPTTPASETPAANAAKKAAKAKASSSSGAGSSISKPAPPTVLKSVSKGQSGSSYEQKSKNLPDVVETG